MVTLHMHASKVYLRSVKMYNSFNQNQNGILRSNGNQGGSGPGGNSGDPGPGPHLGIVWPVWPLPWPDWPFPRLCCEPCPDPDTGRPRQCCYPCSSFYNDWPWPPGEGPLDCCTWCTDDTGRQRLCCPPCRLLHPPYNPYFPCFPPFSFLKRYYPQFIR